MPREAVIGKNDFELMPDQKEADKNVPDDQIVFESGREVPVEINSNIIELNEQRAVMAVVRDLTERNQAEEMLKSERDKLKALLDGLDSTNIGVDIVSIDYEVLQQNQTLIDRFGNIIGKKCYREYMALEEPCSFCPMTKALENKKLERAELQAADGRDYEILAAPLENPDGVVDSAIEVIIDITNRKLAERALLKERDKLQDALAKIKTLRGLIPICSSCKKIRDDKGYWNQIESYIREHSEAEFSHSICPKCAKKLYPDLAFGSIFYFFSVSLQERQRCVS